MWTSVTSSGIGKDVASAETMSILLHRSLFRQCAIFCLAIVLSCSDSSMPITRFTGYVAAILHFLKNETC